MGGLPVETGLDALRPLDLQARAGQIDGMRRQLEALAAVQAVGELELGRRAVDCLVQ